MTFAPGRGPALPSRRGPARLAAASLALVVPLGLSLLAGCGGPASGPGVGGARPATPAAEVAVSVSACGQGWRSPRAGQQTFTLHDTDSRAAEVTLVDPASGAVYASLEPLGAGRSAAMDIDLAPGRYAFRCAMEDEDPVTGPVVTVPGPAGGVGATAVLPVSEQDLIGPAQAYTAYVEGRLPLLGRLVGRLHADLIAGHRARAEADWLTAHLEYERLGAAYGAFGAADAAINGLPQGLPKGTADPGFTGFHRIELGLWSGASTAVLARETAALGRAVDGLRGQLASSEIDPGDVAIRAHEITENALEFELTGRTDFGSHSALATVRANLDGTIEVLSVMHAVLVPRFTGLAATMSAITTTRADLDALRTGHGWPALSALSRAQRERIDSDISELSELLSSVASICEPKVLQ